MVSESFGGMCAFFGGSSRVFGVWWFFFVGSSGYIWGLVGFWGCCSFFGVGGGFGGLEGFGESRRLFLSPARICGVWQNFGGLLGLYGVCVGWGGLGSDGVFGV